MSAEKGAAAAHTQRASPPRGSPEQGKALPSKETPEEMTCLINKQKSEAVSREASSCCREFVLVEEKQQTNGYSVSYQPAGSSTSVGKKQFFEVLQKWQQRSKEAPARLCLERKLMAAAARRDSQRKVQLQRLSEHLQVVKEAPNKKQMLFESKRTNTRKALEAKGLKACKACKRIVERQQVLQKKLTECCDKRAKYSEERQRRVAALRCRLEAREKQAEILRQKYLQKIRNKRIHSNAVAATVSTEA